MKKPTVEQLKSLTKAELLEVAHRACDVIHDVHNGTGRKRVRDFVARELPFYNRVKPYELPKGEFYTLEDFLDKAKLKSFYSGGKVMYANKAKQWVWAGTNALMHEPSHYELENVTHVYCFEECD